MPAYFENGLMVGASAWHKEGKVIDANDPRRFNIRECIELAEMNQRIVLADAYYSYGTDGEFCDKIDGTFATLRIYSDGTIKSLGTVGTKYDPLQPIQTFEWFQPWLDTKEVSIETCGTLRGGRVDWVLVKVLGDNINTGMDEIAKYLTITTSHDGSEATRVGFTPIRIVCANTLAMAHRDSASSLLKVRHTKGQHVAMSVIRDTINLVNQEFEATGAQYARMMQCGLTMSELRRYVKLVLEIDPDMDEKAIGARKSNQIDSIINLAINGKGQDGSKTVWAAYNGVTEYVTHFAGSDQQKRLLSNMGNGTYAAMNRRALELAMQLSA